MHHRIKACRRLAGRKAVGVAPEAEAAHRKLAELSNEKSGVSLEAKTTDGLAVPQFTFSSDQYEARESAADVTLTVMRLGDMSKECQVKYQTLNGTADADK